MADEKETVKTEKTPVPNSMCWCYDIKFSGEPFPTNAETIRKTLVEVNSALDHMNYGDSITLEDVYERLST